MVTWEKKYETGQSQIDEQHQSLFNYINDLEACIKEGEYEGARMAIILNFFQMFCATHFKLEETCMLRTKCPVYQKNKMAHENFLTYYKKFRKQLVEATDKKPLLIKFHEALITWLVNHIVKIDMYMKEIQPETTLVDN